ncbi:EAL domain-containing protein [Falsochrobactrum ovis]|uniref:EAL domain-containing protein (Putative c-di-GMP-specific phosphodiesterase class I) n=1 Tax=Falsochrobactrum ovis TaxID=1293442 RepID=A0A364JRX2_9HYPH|nr:EAL domain-containing protein [Falsochrobactrum ovis]RAK25608.1 EAL domain-containing protein (putative c-di-GMP-specific phosphodiesterase class I) [Falsochrobactrum ovis]
MLDHINILDEKHLEMVAKAIADDRIRSSVQDIRSAVATDEILYGECLARLIDPDGKVYAASEFVPYLEARHDAPMLDRHMLKLVLDLLEVDPKLVLGCNLSAENVSNTPAWNAILVQILDRAYLARRLILEMTETREWTNISFCADVIAEVRGLGCRVALDDFGAGFASPRIVQLIDFDIVKIDRAFIHDIRRSHDGSNSLRHIVAFASCFAPIVVVEGVETVAQVETAQLAGATHIQGHFFSVPVTATVGVPRIEDGS